MIKTLFVDADDTIFNFDAAQKTAIKSAFEKLGYPFNEENYRLYDKINISYWKKLERGETVKDKLIYDRFYDFFEQTGIDGDPLKTEEEYQYMLGEQVQWMDGAQEGVEYLCQKYDVYITTNGYGETQRKRLSISGIDKIAKRVFISEDIGYSKPHIEYYEYCIKQTGAKNDEILCIGDSLTSDIKGGIGAKLKTMWFNFKREPKPDMPIDYIVQNWKEILEIL